MTDVDIPKVGSRGPCVTCRRTLLIITRGMCRTCYRYRNGRDSTIGACVGCDRLMQIVCDGKCGTCYRHQRHPDIGRRTSPRPRDWSAFTDRYARLGPLHTLRPYERAALADVVRVLR